MPSVRETVVAFLTRRYPFYSGCGSFANSAVVTKLAGISHSTAWGKTPGGELLVKLDDYVGRAAFFTGDLDRKITWICQQIIRSGDTVLDIGANIGLVTLCMSRLVGTEGEVHAFEPQPDLQNLLKQSLHRNAISNVRLHGVALGSDEAMLELRIPDGNAGRASVVRNQDDSTCTRFNVPVQTLDRLIQEEGIKKIRLIKIDVEGFEEQVLRGGAGMLQSIRPEAILFELNDSGGSSLHDQPVLELLRKHDYGFFAIPKCLVRMRLQRFDPEECRELPSHDLLAVPRGESYEQMATLMKVNT